MIKQRFLLIRHCRATVLAHSLVLSIGCLFGFDSRSASRTVLVATDNVGGEAIQKALDALPEGGEVVLGPGTYVVRAPIILARDGQSLRGSGPETILYLEANANCPVVILGAPDRGPRPITKLRLSDLLIDGNRERQQVELWRAGTDGSLINNNGVDIRNVTDTVVERVTCRRCRSGGLVTSGGIRRLTVRDFTAFDNHFDGLACYLTEDSRFTGLSLHDNRSAGISLDLSFQHNVIERADLARNDLGIFMRDSRDNTFEDLTIRRSRNHGVFMAQTAEATKAGWQFSPGTQCTGNRFVNLRISESAGSAFRVNDVTCTNNVIAGAEFVDNQRGGLTEAQASLVKTERIDQSRIAGSP